MAELKVTMGSDGRIEIENIESAGPLSPGDVQFDSREDITRTKGHGGQFLGHIGADYFREQIVNQTAQELEDEYNEAVDRLSADPANTTLQHELELQRARLDAIVHNINSSSNPAVEELQRRMADIALEEIEGIAVDGMTCPPKPPSF